MTVSAEKLIEMAKEAREKAYVPYSKFKVGAALLTEEGKIFTGCNVENASYGLTCCAERTAVFKAVSEGYKNFAAIAVVADVPTLCSPCGACRQVLSEFGGKIKVHMANLEGQYVTTTVEELLPGYFTARDMEKE
ncbi:cytidine deaminase [Desulforamulus putei]|uniref:Cytidine deaminase n=1 Tax=Desulforamulus putei DSM 12395 TaxID=1121429 RepID=A0A1M5C142_9FIRM|nr:cytidine deaminase [Desulforamulus putei]SHF48386.1 cytidine deaminase [Desulforamulus putei DSM 12395]